MIHILPHANSVVRPRCSRRQVRFSSFTSSLVMRTHLLHFVFIHKSETFICNSSSFIRVEPGGQGVRSVAQLATVRQARAVPPLYSPCYTLVWSSRSSTQKWSHRYPQWRKTSNRSCSVNNHSHPRRLTDEPPPNLALPTWPRPTLFPPNQRTYPASFL
jgi:hypothetical protein